ncbi:MAG: hypothetical protein NDI61_10915 [Bdellovibrionaceae bacterium]|nr:hypothetical protein [Pseudobdellovibrionaceae bacterium]
MNFLSRAKTRVRLFLFLLTLTLTLTGIGLSQAQARPEYAVRHGFNRCTLCHFAPAGGGDRTLAGKFYGARGYKTPEWMQYDFAHLDVRSLYYQTQAPSKKGGMGLMDGIVALSVPAITEDDGYEVRLTHTVNLGGFGAAGRNTYIRWRQHDDTKTSWLPQYLYVGRFLPPFGLTNDEHRTYTKMQVGKAWSTDFEIGGLIASNPTEWLHYDYAIVNGQNAGNGILGDEQGDLWGHILNLRIAPAQWPVMFGTSASQHDRAGVNKKDPWASTVYGLVSLDRLSKGWLRGSALVEYTRAQHWNENLSTYRFMEQNYITAVAEHVSEGIWAQLTLDLSQRLALIYKYDSLIVSKDFPADAFDRHGVGVRWYWGPNGILTARYEDARARAPGEAASTNVGATDAYWFLLQLTI